MSANYAILNDDWILRGWRSMEHMLANWRRNTIHSLTEDMFYVLESCDGHCDFSSPAFLPKHVSILEKFIKNGIANQCEYGQELHPSQRYRLADNTIINALLWSITGKCNFNCRHCFMNAPEGIYGEFTADQIWQVLDQIEAANVLRVAITGGEPLLFEELPTLLKRLKDKHIGLVEFFTNASLITENLIACFKETGYRPHFKVSFDCVGSHDYMRGTVGAEDATIRGIRMLKEHGYAVTVVTSIDRIVASGMNDTLDLLVSLGIDNWWMAPPVEVGCWGNSKTQIPTKDLISAMKEVLRRWVDYGRPFSLKLWRFGNFNAKHVGEIYIKQTIPIENNSWNCEATHGMGYLMPNGKLLPCGSLTGLDITADMPNIYQIPLSKAWDLQSLSKYCNLKKSEVLSHNISCQKCRYFWECGSGCRTMALIETGNYWNRDPVICNLFHSGVMHSFREYAMSLES